MNLKPNSVAHSAAPLIYSIRRLLAIHFIHLIIPVKPLFYNVSPDYYLHSFC